MVWSFIKILLFVAVVAGLSLLASFIAETGSEVRFVIAEHEISTSSYTFAIFIILLFPAFGLLFFVIGLMRAVVRFLLGDETALTRYFNRNREQRGFEALADGLLALSSGEPKLAMAKVARAENLLDRAEITAIVSAQAAEKSGNKEKAIEAYKRMLGDKRTRFAGIAGLLKHRLDDGDSKTALKLAEKAFVLNPQHDDMQNTLLQLQSTEEDWEGARRTLKAKLKHWNIPRDVYRRRNAILTFASARDKILRGEKDEGDKEALAANKACPNLVPAAVLAAEVKDASGHRKAAENILEKAWKIQPHPDLAAAFAALVPDETPAGRKKRFQKLVAKNSHHPEARMLMAELSIAQEDYPAARREIGTLPDEHPTVRSLAIIAAIERGEGSSDSIVRGWLMKAVSAPRGPQWTCSICHSRLSEWAPVCNQCDGFDTLEWAEGSEESELPENHKGLLTLLTMDSREEEVSDNQGIEKSEVQGTVDEKIKV